MELTSPFSGEGQMVHRGKRELILKAAEALFTARRFDQVTLEDVCEKGRVGKGTIYRYFRDKEDLYAQVVLSGLDELHNSLEHRVSRSTVPDRELLAIAEALRRSHCKRESLFRSLHSMWLRQSVGRGTLREELRARQRRIMSLVSSVISAGVERGQYRRDMAPPLAARMFLAMAREAIRRPDAEGSHPVRVKSVVALFLDGVRKR